MTLTIVGILFFAVTVAIVINTIAEYRHTKRLREFVEDIRRIRLEIEEQERLQMRTWR